VCRIDNVEQDIWPLGELFHVPLFVSPGAPFGASPIEMHRQTIGLPIAAQRFGARFFGSGAHPTTLLMPDSDPGEDGARSLKRKFMEATFGSREPIVVPQHVKVERLSIAPDESQFLETQRYGVEEVARVFLGGFAEMIGGSTSGQSVTYANAEQRDAAFLRYGLSRYLVPLEASLSTLLPRGRKVKFNVASLLRGDLAARYASYRVSAEIEALTGKPVLMSDEIRELEDRPPLPDDYASGRVVPTPARER
jgi:HK97 family phage portal protein